MRSVLTLERELVVNPHGLGAGLVLGAEFNHIRNAIAHRNYRIIRTKKAIEFWDPDRRGEDDWRVTYPYSEFIVLFFHAALWGSGLMMARTLEDTDLTALVYAGLLEGVPRDES